MNIWLILFTLISTFLFLKTFCLPDSIWEELKEEWKEDNR